MKTSSAKAKGRRLQTYVGDTLRAAFRLQEPDLRPAIMGETGMDIQMSTAARECWPFATEIKNVERLNVWQALEQACAHAGTTGLKPLLVFSRNRSKVWAVLDFELLVAMQKELRKLRLVDEAETAAWGEVW